MAVQIQNLKILKGWKTDWKQWFYQDCMISVSNNTVKMCVTCDEQVIIQNLPLIENSNLLKNYVLTVLFSIPFDKLPWWASSSEDSSVPPEATSMMISREKKCAVVF